MSINSENLPLHLEVNVEGINYKNVSQILETELSDRLLVPPVKSVGYKLAAKTLIVKPKTMWEIYQREYSKVQWKKEKMPFAVPLPISL